MSMMVEPHVKYFVLDSVSQSNHVHCILCIDHTVRSMRRSLSLGRRRTGSESRSAMELEEAAQVTYCSLGLCLPSWQELHSIRASQISSCSEPCHSACSFLERKFFTQNYFLFGCYYIQQKG